MRQKSDSKDTKGHHDFAISLLLCNLCPLSTCKQWTAEQPITNYPGLPYNDNDDGNDNDSNNNDKDGYCS